MENYVLHNKRNPKSSFDANDDEVALALAPLVDEALTEAAQRGGSPHASQKSYKRSKQKFSPAQSRQRMVLNGSPTCSAIILFLLAVLLLQKMNLDFGFLNKHQYLNI